MSYTGGQSWPDIGAPCSSWAKGGELPCLACLEERESGDNPSMGECVHFPFLPGKEGKIVPSFGSGAAGYHTVRPNGESFGQQCVFFPFSQLFSLFSYIILFRLEMSFPYMEVDIAVNALGRNGFSCFLLAHKPPSPSSPPRCPSTSDLRSQPAASWLSSSRAPPQVAGTCWQTARNLGGKDTK